MSEVVDRLNAALEGRYRIEQELGAGGMATVFLAQDIRHNRQVAVKVLKPELAAVVGAERFLAEIETTANLQHPHILPLYDSGEADSFLFYVMPYVEGESLADRLDREQQLPVDEALRLTRAIAGALDYAHRQGVVHRDIKPANILLHEGEPLVADFGIALAVSQAGDGRITETGLSLGTPHYMSPEQAAGERTLDKRSDVYALGCVLYEMLTGTPPFGGPNAQAVLGRILTGDPDPVTEHRRAVPPNVEAAVHKSLQRLPADRFESAAALVRALDDPGFTTTVGSVTRGGAVAEARWRRRFGAVAMVAAVLAAVAVAGWLSRGDGAGERLVRFSLPLPFSSVDLQLAVSPDGARIAYANISGGQTYVRELDRLESRRIPDRAVRPGFSPDGGSLLLTSPAQDVRIEPVAGGPQRTVAQSRIFLSTVWGEDGFVYFGPPAQSAPWLGRVPAEGGRIDTIIPPDTTAFAFEPLVVLPGGRGLVYKRLSQAGAEIHALDLESGERRFIAQTQDVGSVAYSATGHLLYSADRFLLALPFDARSAEPVGEPVPAAEVENGSMRFAYGGGTLVYAATGASGALVPMISDRAGTMRPLPGLEEGSFDYPEVSPDGERIAMLVAEEGAQNDIWIYEMPTGPLSRLSQAGGANTTTWADGGEDILFLSDGDAYRTRSDGSEEPELILDLERDLSRLALGPDETKLYYQIGPGQWDIGVTTLGEAGSDSLLLQGDYWEGHPAVSPDGRWLAYYSNESGAASEVFVRPLEGPGRKHQISRSGGLRPRWSSDGTELFFSGDPSVGENGLWVATLDVGPEDLDVVEIRRLFDMPTYNYDVFPGDSQFVTLMPSGGEDLSNELNVVVNFDRVLRELGQGTNR